MFATFSSTPENNNLVWYFTRVYLYSFISVFIYVILSLFIAIIMDTYEMIKEYAKRRMAQEENPSLLQAGQVQPRVRSLQAGPDAGDQQFRVAGRVLEGLQGPERGGGAPRAVGHAAD